MSSAFLTIISFVIIFTLVVVSHEFGHYLIGRLNGMEVSEFAIGMGPAIFKKKFKHTTLAIRLFPIGGACIFKGMELEDEEELTEDVLELITKNPEPGSYNSVKVWGRIATVIAGPMFNIVLAFILSLFTCWFSPADLPVLSGVSEGYPAQEAGLQEGDIIKNINGQNIHLWREVSVISMMSAGKRLNIVYERDGREYMTTIDPKYSEGDDRYYIGLIGSGKYVDCNNLSVFKYSAYEVRYWLIATYRSLEFMISGNGSISDLSGPVGIATAIDETIEETRPYGAFLVILNLTNLTVLLSVNLGVLNLLPIPAVDGGRLLLQLIEAITGKRVPPDKEGMFHLIGFILLMLLMVVVLFNDVKQIFIR